MPSFDVVSEVNLHEVSNAVDQSNREVGTRFDFKGSNARYELAESVVTLRAETEFQVQQMLDILHIKLAKRSVDIGCLKIDPPEVAGRETRQKVTVRQGIETLMAKDIVKKIKESKLKVQASIQGEQVRITGKQRDDLQDAIALIRGAKWEVPVQFTNFRD